MSSRVFVDTNVWVYTVDAGAPAKQKQARIALSPAPEKDIVISAQVLGEFYVTVRRKLAESLPETDAIALVERMRRLPVVPIDGDLVATAIANASGWQLSYWDALIVAAAESASCDLLLTEDLSHGRAYGSVRVENPFLAGPQAEETSAPDG